jgi:phytoene dehydrogenase-like protein
VKKEVFLSNKSIIIVGGGIAGLSAGCYGQMNGFRTRIFEMHKKKPGGLCTSWKRQGYTVNGCLHWLVGSGVGSPYHDMWQELGALADKTVINYEEFLRVEFTNGRKLAVYSDIDRLEKHLKEIAPDDAVLIDEFIGAVRVCTRYHPPVKKAPEVAGLFDMLWMMITKFPLLRILRKWNITLTEYAGRFKSPLIREAIPLLFVPDMPVSFIIMNFAWIHEKTAGYVIGGSLSFSQAIEKRYLALGGEIIYQSKVARILTEHDRAVGVRLEDGSEHYADFAISASDGHATIFDMLEGKYVDDTIRGYYEKLVPFPPLVFLSLGVNRTFSDLPASARGISLQLDEPLVVGGVEQKYLGVRVYNFDPTLAPAGKTLLTVLFRTNYDYWQNLRQNDSSTGRERKDRRHGHSPSDKCFPDRRASRDARCRVTHDLRTIYR